jgi:thiosulfate/3-mercaptopyruvate sulfurtransferase
LYEKVDFTNFQPQLFKTKEQVLENIQTKEALLVDARSTDRFLAETEERAEKWIPGSINIPYTQLLKDGKFYLKKR